MRRSLYHSVKAIRALNTSAISTNTDTDGPSVSLDQSGADFTVASLVVLSGAVTDGTYTVVPQESPTGSGSWTDIPAERLQGSAALTAANSLGEVGVVTDPGAAPFIRCRITSTAVTTGGSVSAVWLLGSGDVVPVRRS